MDPTSEANNLPDAEHVTHGSEANGSGSNGSGSGIGGTLTTLDSRLPSTVGATDWSYGPPARPEILKAKPNPVELLHAVRRRWPLAIGLGLLVGGIATGLLWFLVPVRYEAYALLRVAGRAPAVLERTGGAVEEFAVFKRTQVQLILSNVVMQGTLREADINRLATLQEHKEDQISWLRDQLLIDYPDDAEIMRLAMKGKRREDLTKIVNKVVATYMREIVQHEAEMRFEQENKLERTYTSLMNDYKKEQDALHTLEALHKTSGSESARLKKELARDELTKFLTQRARLIGEIDACEMHIMLLKARRDHPEETRPPDVVIDLEMTKDPVIGQASRDLAQLAENMQEIMSRPAGSNPNSPTIKKMKQKMARLEDRIEERKATLRPQYIEMMATSGVTSQNSSSGLSLPLLETQKDHFEEKLKGIDEAIEKQIEVVENMDNYSTAVGAKQEELRGLQKITNELRSALDRIKVERQAPERITKVDDAVLANSSGDAIRKYIAVAFAAILGFGLVVLGVAFVEFQARKINSVEEVKDGLGIRVVGELPNVSGRTWKRIKGGKGQSVLRALMAERIDGTRTALIHSAAADPPRVVMVTSAEPHEGKTTTASQLAASLARSGRRTLLIDADIRNPGTHRVFEMPQDPGLCELLRGEADREAVIHPTRTANLWLMPAGRCDLRSVQALSTSYLGTAIAALCVQFDYLIIDSGPVLKIADPLLIGQHVDAAILSVLRDVSKVPKVYEACERLRSVGITVLGSVVNGVKDDAARHGVELLMAETPQSKPTETTSA